MLLPITSHDADIALKNAKLTCFSFLSSDRKTKLAAYRFTPISPIGEFETETPPRAVVQISHGMCEYLLRYTPIADFLCAANIEVWGHDHLGHGYSATGASSFGFLGENDGADRLIEDVHLLTREIRKARMSAPIFLLGHSMGSFIVRNVLSEYGTDYEGAILMGTAGNQDPTTLGKGICNFVASFHGKTYRSEWIKKNAFRGYNREFGKGVPDTAWLTRDEDALALYNADPFCRFTFTVQGYHDLFELLGRVSKRSWAGTVPKDLPVLLLAGDADPVGARGKGVIQVYERLQNAGVSDVKMRLYPGARHELLNETNKEEVRADLLAWLEERI